MNVKRLGGGGGGGGGEGVFGVFSFLEHISKLTVKFISDSAKPLLFLLFRDGIPCVSFF